LDGLWFVSRGEWLSELCEKGHAKLDGFETIDGVRCPRLIVEEQTGGKCPVLLDPEHAFLPRIVHYTGKNEITEYRQLNGVWIPWAGTYDEDHWEMVDAGVNEDLDPRLFEPPIAVGTDVTDNISGARYIHGGNVNRQQGEERIIGEARENLDRLGQPIAATPGGVSAVTWMGIILGVSCTFLLIAFWLSRRGS
jgi:hypothetical protein